MAKYFSNLSEEEIEKQYKIVAKNVKRLRKARNQTLMDLSLDLGFRSAAFLSAAENSKDNKKFNLEQLFKIQKLYEIDMNEFFKEI